MRIDYFNEQMVNRQRLIWAIATRRQLERWEPFVAAAVRGSLAQPERKLSGADIWAAQIEHHFALLAARNLLRALELAPPWTPPVEATMRAELIEARDLNEHWPENMPVFNVQPRVADPPRPSGRSFAARNPGHRPYSWLKWRSKAGALLTPHVSASALHVLLDAVEADVLAKQETLAAYVPPRDPSPWVVKDGDWLPAPEPI